MNKSNSVRGIILSMKKGDTHTFSSKDSDAIRTAKSSAKRLLSPDTPIYKVDENTTPGKIIVTRTK